MFDPEQYTSEQVDSAVQRVLSRHSDFIGDDFAYMHVALTGAALKAKPAIDAALATLDPNDPRLPEWLKKLASDEKTKVDAAFIIVLAQSAVPVDEEKAAYAKDPFAWALSKYVPANTAEQALAATDPMTFAVLKYLGGSLDPHKFGDFTDIAQRNLARNLVERKATAALATTSGRQKMATLQILTMAVKDVRADYVESMVTTILAGQSAEDGVKQIQARNDQPISPLRRRMIEGMTVRNLSPATQQSYVYAVANKLGLDEVRAYQLDPIGLSQIDSSAKRISMGCATSAASQPVFAAIHTADIGSRTDPPLPAPA